MASHRKNWARLPRIAKRALYLLKQSDDPRSDEDWALHRLEDESLYGGPRPSSNSTPAQWTERVIAQNPDLYDQSLMWLRERTSTRRGRRLLRT
jgi:hypothetical protein